MLHLSGNSSQMMEPAIGHLSRGIRIHVIFCNEIWFPSQKSQRVRVIYGWKSFFSASHNKLSGNWMMECCAKMPKAQPFCGETHDPGFEDHTQAVPLPGAAAPGHFL
jgi:hypothetical protein